MEGEDGLDGGFYGFAADVAAGAGSSEGLLFVVAGEDAEVAGDAGLDGDLLDAGRGLDRDVLIVIGLVADDGAKADDSVVVVRVGGVQGGYRKLEGARDPEDIVRGDTVTLDRLLSAGEKTRGDVLVEAGDDDRKGDAGAVEGGDVWGHGVSIIQASDSVIAGL